VSILNGTSAHNRLVIYKQGGVKVSRTVLPCDRM